MVLDHPHSRAPSSETGVSERSQYLPLVRPIQRPTARGVPYKESIVQLDEAYFRDWCLLMGKQVGSRKLAYELIYKSHPNKLDANSFLFEKVSPGAKLWTDGSQLYTQAPDYWPVEHSRDIHKKFEFAHTSEIEGTFGILRTFIRRMYHHVTPEKFPDYVREFCFRFSNPELFDSPRLYLEKTLILVPTR